MIFCFYKRQIELFVEQNWFQCDMAFKRLKEKRQKEIVFAIMNKQNNKSRWHMLRYSQYITNILVAFTLVRVIVNQDSVEMYHRMFTRVFSLMEERLQTSIHWQHLHGDGFTAMVMDMDTKQLPGERIINIFLTCYLHIDNRFRSLPCRP